MESFLVEGQLERIALVLFGILLCCAEKGLNSIVLSNFSDFSFPCLGVIVGMEGLFFTFRKAENK